jgi:hypothetical protein
MDSEAIREWMKEKGYLSSRIALETGFSRTHVASIIRGEYSGQPVVDWLKGHGCPSEYFDFDQAPSRRTWKNKDQAKIERVRRRCLKCDRPFLAKGRFNRICPKCTEANASVLSRSYSVHAT